MLCGVAVCAPTVVGGAEHRGVNRSATRLNLGGFLDLAAAYVQWWRWQCGSGNVEQLDDDGDKADEVLFCDLHASNREQLQKKTAKSKGQGHSTRLTNDC